MSSVLYTLSGRWSSNIFGITLSSMKSSAVAHRISNVGPPVPAFLQRKFIQHHMQKKLWRYLSALVFFLLTMCKILPAVKSLIFENLLTHMSRDRRAASCNHHNYAIIQRKMVIPSTVDAATVGIERSRSGDRPPGTVAISSLHVVSKSPEGTPKRA